MVRAWRFANGAIWRAVSNSAWCRIFREISWFSPLTIGTLFRCCVLGLGTLPSYASLGSGVNEYLVGQRWQCVRLVYSAEMAAVPYVPKRELKWHMNEQVQWPGVMCVKRIEFCMGAILELTIIIIQSHRRKRCVSCGGDLNVGAAQPFQGLSCSNIGGQWLLPR